MIPGRRTSLLHKRREGACRMPFLQHEDPKVYQEYDKNTLKKEYIHTESVLSRIFTSRGCFANLVLAVTFLLCLDGTFRFLAKHKKNQELLRIQNKSLKLQLSQPPTIEKLQLTYEETTDADYTAKIRFMEETLSKNFTGIQSCRRGKDGHYKLFHYHCLHQVGERELVFYNPFRKSRDVCGKAIRPNEYIVLRDLDLGTRRCFTERSPFGIQEKTSIFPTTPSSLLSHEFPAIVILKEPQAKTLEPVQGCNIKCNTSPAYGPPKFIAGTDWEFIYSMEGPQYYKYLQIDQFAHHHDKFYATTSFESEIPLPYFSFAEYNLTSNPPVSYQKAIKGAVYIAHNCASANGREDIVRELIRSPHIRVDSVSKCLKNVFRPQPEKKEDILRQYLFYLAFENQNENDYITEKVWLTLQAGTIPVYFGASNIKEHVPPHSIIDVHDFDSPQELAAYLGKVASNQQLYDSYHAWRNQPLPDAFHRKYDFTRIHSLCRMCRWAYAKQYGLVWNHPKQAIEDPTISRNACFRTPSKLLSNPVREAWYTPGASGELVDISVDGPLSDDNDDETCSSIPRSHPFKSSITLLDGTIRRTVISRDGIVDLFLEPLVSYAPEIPKAIELHMAISTRVMNGKHPLLERINQHTYWLQDDISRISVLTSRTDISLSVTAVAAEKAKVLSAVIRIIIPRVYVPLQLRLVTEDIDTFYKDSISKESYFGKLMLEDFMNPIEVFSFIPPKGSQATGVAKAKHEPEEGKGLRQAPDTKRTVHVIRK